MALDEIVKLFGLSQKFLWCQNWKISPPDFKAHSARRNETPIFVALVLLLGERAQTS
jgi:hypothetical protein